ncbi:hypothetical protein YC2023_078195 [Brassica napus]
MSKNPEENFSNLCFLSSGQVHFHYQSIPLRVVAEPVCNEGGQLTHALRFFLACKPEKEIQVIQYMWSRGIQSESHHYKVVVYALARINTPYFFKHAIYLIRSFPDAQTGVTINAILSRCIPPLGVEDFSKEESSGHHHTCSVSGEYVFCATAKQLSLFDYHTTSSLVFWSTVPLESWLLLFCQHSTYLNYGWKHMLPPHVLRATVQRTKQVNKEVVYISCGDDESS